VPGEKRLPTVGGNESCPAFFGSSSKRVETRTGERGNTRQPFSSPLASTDASFCPVTSSIRSLPLRCAGLRLRPDRASASGLRRDTPGRGNAAWRLQPGCFPRVELRWPQLVARNATFMEAHEFRLHDLNQPLLVTRRSYAGCPFSDPCNSLRL